MTTQPPAPPVPPHSTMWDVLAEIAADYDPADSSKARVGLTAGGRTHWGRIAHVGTDVFALVSEQLFAEGEPPSTAWYRIDTVTSVGRQ